METNQTNSHHPFKVVAVCLLFMLLSSCDVISGIFKAGMGFGIFIVIAVVALVVAIIVKFGKK